MSDNDDDESPERSTQKPIDADVDTAGTDAEAGVELPSGKGLSPHEAGLVCRGSRTQLIVLAGTHRSGKTTLIKSIYEAFLRGPFAGFVFAGSQSLLGFEERCHLARIESEAAAAETERTLLATQPYLHLAVRSEDLFSATRNVLFTDLPGEIFRLALSSEDECRQVVAFLRSDLVAILIDGARLADDSARHQAAAEARTILRSCLEAEMLGDKSFVQFVFSKWDLVAKAGAPAIGFAAQLEETMKERFARKVGDLSFSRLAAQPEQGSQLQGRYGVEGFLQSCLKAGARGTARMLPLPSYKDLHREIDRFILKVQR